MSSQHSRNHSWKWAGCLVALVGVLCALPWVTSAAPTRTVPASQHLVTHEYAQDLTARFRASATPGAVYAQDMDRSAFDALLAQPGAAGIRIYYAKYPDGRDTVVLYAYGRTGQNFDEMPANASSPCPPCGGTSDTESGTFKLTRPTHSHLVSREHAQDAIARFRASAAPGTVYAQDMDRSAFDALLAQHGAVGIRIYYAKYPDGRDTVVLYAYDENGRDFVSMPMNLARPYPTDDSTPDTELP